jgi:hypothetical protein
MIAEYGRTAIVRGHILQSPVSALGSLPSVALSSGQALAKYHMLIKQQDNLSSK